MPSLRNVRLSGNISRGGTLAIPTPLEIKKTGPTEIKVDWDDEHQSLFRTDYLRSECACAGCVNEITGERMIDLSDVSPDITVTAAEHVGRYGVKFQFSDGHCNGIYTWERLRRICPCDRCQ